MGSWPHDVIEIRGGRGGEGGQNWTLPKKEKMQIFAN